ncbi:putative oxidoreductase YcjS [Aquisphaera giovannonii]|uniref:Putative oxidoreductase YcjS n=1 Tax=Aquisphaera giovannonii TaxID=406548 RepID=A0A5B9W104_9BACT|nr:Gfo/Idh/MocA family oxidoreductase [Aquisphaera giovannonii]QEH33904.1 putative oxidoreductase YcjS [Aquisphaera giovannonii]
MKRRDFLTRAAIAGAAGPFVGGTVPSFAAAAQGRSPNEKVRFACIGVGGKGDSDTNDAGAHGEIVALCDVDARTLDKMGDKYPKAKKYYDYRKMLEELGDKIDAVTVSTPDHTHAPASVMAMRMGKHCFCQKPLTWSIEEARLMRTLAAEKNLCTQMGNQGTAADGFRQGVETVRSGAIGAVKEIHVWTNRPIWPQGIPRPKETPGVPNHIRWYEFLGAAPDQPYHPAYGAFNWRGWLDFGTGALGDMACHTINVAAMALELFDPESVEVVDTSGIVDHASYPAWSIIRTHFGARNGRPPLTMTWYDGGDKLPEGKKAFRELLYGQKLPDSGLLLVGEQGSFFSENDYGAEHTLLPGDRYKDFKEPDVKLPRSPGHFTEWVEAIKTGNPKKALSNFDYAGRLTETVLLGVVALKAGTKIEWDADAMKARNCPDADQYIRRNYRKGFSIH